MKEEGGTTVGLSEDENRGNTGEVGVGEPKLRMYRKTLWKSTAL